MKRKDIIGIRLEKALTHNAQVKSGQHDATRMRFAVKKPYIENQGLVLILGDDVSLIHGLQR